MHCEFWLQEQAQSNGNRLAIVTNQLSLTYEELYHRAKQSRNI